MLDQNTDRSGWGMLALVVLGAAALALSTFIPETIDLVMDQIRELFTSTIN